MEKNMPNVSRVKRKRGRITEEATWAGRASLWMSHGPTWSGVLCVLICLYIVQSLFLILHSKSLNGRNHFLCF